MIQFLTREKGGEVAEEQPTLKFLKITLCCDLTRVWRVKERVCQPFEVCQHEFANLSLPCEGRFTLALLKHT